MHLVTVRAILGLALVCSGCGAPQLSVGTGTRAWSEPSPWGLDRAERDDWVVIPGYGYSPLHRPSIVCDRFGRCWQRAPYDRFARGYVGRGNAEPPEWAENLPDSARVRDRFLRPRANVVCDRATRIC